MGGNLSFVIAMLDGNNTGFVLDVVHSREGCYIYLKEVEEGATEVLLGSEEQEALEQALGYVKRPSISDGDGKEDGEKRQKTCIPALENSPLRFPEVREIRASG